MRCFLPALFVLLIMFRVAAQDTIRVTYSEEPDTLTIRQKFIDRYENVFMTRIPTSNLIKAGYSASDVRGIGIAVGYEYKILPGLSIEASIYKKTNGPGDGIFLNTFTREWERDWWIGARARWYYNMSKRIDKGLNANNFSGGYLSAIIDRRVGGLDLSSPVNSNRHRLAVAAGFQSRVFNHGHIDISLGAYYLDQSYEYSNFFGRQMNQTLSGKKFILSTQMTVGLAFGDWKRKAPTEVCDVLLCDEEIQNQWKLRFPEFSLGLGQRSLRFGIAREAKFGNSPFSIEINANAEFYDTEITRMKGFFVKTGLQGRYYFLQQMQIRRGESGNNLSGFYTALEIANFLTKRNKPSDNFSEKYWGASLSAGFQQRLFENIYIDTAVSVNQFSANAPFPYDNNRRRISARLALGFTF
jgi:hypothetical protein